MENKTSKYFKYAIGEIILVVIGILIALQINTWYENSKKDKLTVVYTHNLINDLTKDTIQLNARIKKNKNTFLKTSDSLIAIIQNPNTNVNDIKELGKTNGISGLRTLNAYNRNTFNILTSTGNIDLFNDAIIQKIMELSRLQNFQMSVAKGNKESYFNLYGRYLEHYSRDSYGSELTIETLWENVDALKHAPIYISAIYTQRHSVTRYIELTTEVLEKSEELLDILKTELSYND